MPLFVCDRCDTIENTALGFYWGKWNYGWKDETLNGKALCSGCSPTQLADGTRNKRGGGWHGQFPREIATEAKLLKSGLDRFVHLGKFEYLRTRRI